ncbi:MAG: tRNA (adenosine(37)-N6)-threonylcarbamoyltransferase complex ATPase subunit type 1 TsaE [Acidiphilium sp.]
MATRTIMLEDEAATIALARQLAARTVAGDALLLAGPLGAGKSTLARAFIRARAGDEALDVPSPSFTLAQSYELDPPVAHFDLWRLGGPNEVAELGFEAALSGIVLVEWPDRLGPLAPADALRIALEWGAGEARVATVSGPGALLARLLE